MNLLICKVHSISRRKVELEKEVNKVETSKSIQEVNDELVKLKFEVLKEAKSLFEHLPEEWSERHFDVLLSLKESYSRGLEEERFIEELLSNCPWVKDLFVNFNDLSTDIYLYYNNDGNDLLSDEESKIVIASIKKNAQRVKKVEGLSPVSSYNLTTLVEEIERRLIRGFDRTDNLEKFLEGRSSEINTSLRTLNDTLGKESFYLISFLGITGCLVILTLVARLLLRFIYG